MSKLKQLEVGNEVNAYCPKCKSETVHVIESIKNDKIAKVMCKSCLSSHKYKSVDEVEATHKTKAAKKTAAPKVAKTREERKWARLLAKVNQENPLEYTMGATYTEQDVIQHTTFGLGIVVKIIDENRMDVFFKEGLKKLVMNRAKY